MLKNLGLIPILVLCNCAGALHGSVTDGADQAVERYQHYVAEGKRHLAENDPASALASFRAADSVEFFEAPNYESLVYVAEAQCLTGAFETGLTTLGDFRCALSVDAGEKPCFVGEPTRTSPGEPNPELTEVCFQRMCSEAYLDYYTVTDVEKTQRLEMMRRQATAVADTCSSSGD